MGRFYGDAGRTRILSVVAKLGPVAMRDLARYAAVKQSNAHKTTYRLALGGLVSIFHSGDERRRTWITLNRDADYSNAMARLILKVSSFQKLPFAGLKKANDAKIARLLREKSESTALLDRLIRREAILDT
ncbi:MAG TPA: hypothetical protein VHT53_06120 [Candidatus Elarobacter sp.]|jgi:DNA-binding MarR family transcriptional regulator|nr:hypothetical protein [Candidatus Elarobacter sp.]